MSNEASTPAVLPAIEIEGWPYVLRLHGLPPCDAPVVPTLDHLAKLLGALPDEHLLTVLAKMGITGPQRFAHELIEERLARKAWEHAARSIAATVCRDGGQRCAGLDAKGVEEETILVYLNSSRTEEEFRAERDARLRAEEELAERRGHW